MASAAIRNVHQRRFAADPGSLDELGRLLDALGGPDDRLWPHRRWPAMVVPRPITIGSAAGHADVRYFVDEYRPGEALWFRFDPSCGLEGRHGLTVEPHDDGTVALTHVLEGRAVGSGRVQWPLMIRAMHDALVEELLDNAEALLPGAAVQPAPHDRPRFDGRSRWGLALRSVFAAVHRLRSVPHRPARAVAVAGLAGAAVLHAAWAVGVDWPGADRVDLAHKVVGGDKFPSGAATWTVTGLLAAAAGATAATGTRLGQPHADRLVTAAGSTVAAVLALRAVVGTIASASHLVGGRRTAFAGRDLLVYSPLCVALALAVTSSVLNRPTELAH